MIRRITTKWLLVVLLSVVVPLAGFAVITATTVRTRMAGDVVRFHLQSMAADLAVRIDKELEERKRDAEGLAADPTMYWYIGKLDEERGDFYLGQCQQKLDQMIESHEIYDLIFAVDDQGKSQVSSRVNPEGARIDESVRALADRDFSNEPWFKTAMSEGEAIIDWHQSDLLGPARVPEPGESLQPEDYCIGFAKRIDPVDGFNHYPGVVYLQMNWKYIQGQTTDYGVRHFKARAGGSTGGVGEDIYESSYSWIWSSDADTIIAHKAYSLYGQTVSGLGLPQLVDAARGAEYGMYPDYSFEGIGKKAAFDHCNNKDEGGLGWVVGVGVNNEDVYGPVEELSRILFGVSLIVLSLAVVLTVFLARRMTRPILELQQHTRRIASGDLDTKIEINRHDEIGDLGESFNRMTTELKENRAHLVKAEKDAAWREMARQVAHEIKNPLTPISLSASLLKRAHDEGSPEFDSILERTIEMIQRQVVNMREIARDFYAFAGEHKESVDFDMCPIVDDVLELNAAWAAEIGVEMHREGGVGVVHGDQGELRRALINLVSNALEAMNEGGQLTVKILDTGGIVKVEVRDTGPGLEGDVAERLFEPYFTTRSSGTGLGLAIVRRVIEDMGGTVELQNATDGPGAVARLVLPSPA
jgi:signal transduction histidine kinase